MCAHCVVYVCSVCVECVFSVCILCVYCVCVLQCIPYCVWEYARVNQFDLGLSLIDVVSQGNLDQ